MVVFSAKLSVGEHTELTRYIHKSQICGFLVSCISMGYGLLMLTGGHSGVSSTGLPQPGIC